MFGPKGPVCQSCGMPLSKDPLGGGTNLDGTKSSDYCGHCFQKGRFTEPHLTAQEMAAKVEQKLRQMHFPGFLARFFTRRIPALRRWRETSGVPAT